MASLHDEKWLDYQIKILEKALEIATRNNKEKRKDYKAELERLKRLRQEKLTQDSMKGSLCGPFIYWIQTNRVVEIQDPNTRDSMVEKGSTIGKKLKETK